MDNENAIAGNNLSPGSETAANPTPTNNVNLSVNQPEVPLLEDIRETDKDFHDASDFLEPEEENVQRRKVSQRELAGLGSVNSQGLLESEVFTSRRPKPTLNSLKIEYDVLLEHALEKGLYVPAERQDPILPIMETSIKSSFGVLPTKLRS